MQHQAYRELLFLLLASSALKAGVDQLCPMGFMSSSRKPGEPEVWRRDLCESWAASGWVAWALECELISVCVGVCMCVCIQVCAPHMCMRVRMCRWMMRRSVLSSSAQIQKQDSILGFCSDSWKNCPKLRVIIRCELPFWGGIMQ